MIFSVVIFQNEATKVILFLEKHESRRLLENN